MEFSRRSAVASADIFLRREVRIPRRAFCMIGKFRELSYHTKETRHLRFIAMCLVSFVVLFSRSASLNCLLFLPALLVNPAKFRKCYIGAKFKLRANHMVIGFLIGRTTILSIIV